MQEQSIQTIHQPVVDQVKARPREQAAPKTKTRKVRKRVIVEEDVTECQNPKDYEPVTFLFYNEEQRGVPVDYEWVDKWLRPGQCKGTFHDGQKYTLPRIVFQYYKEQCSMPKYANEEREIVPGQPRMISVEKGRIYRFRMEELKA